jgi:fucose permease
MLLALSGLGISVFKIGALALVGDVSASTTAHTRFMNTIEGFFAVGAIVGPAVVATLIARGLSWKWLYVAAALICVLLVAMASRVRYPHSTKDAAESATLREMVGVLRDPLALGMSALVMFYVAVEVAVYVWMPTYLLAYGGSFAWLPGYALALFFVLRAAGRFLGGWLLAHVSWTAALALVGTAIFVCFLGSLSFGVDAAAWLLPLSGLFMSIVYPTLNSKGISCFPKSQHGAAAGVILFFTAAAAALGPLAMGAISDAYGTTEAGFVLATVLAFLLLAGLLGNWLLDPFGRRLRASDHDDYGRVQPASSGRPPGTAAAAADPAK